MLVIITNPKMLPLPLSHNYGLKFKCKSVQLVPIDFHTLDWPPLFFFASKFTLIIDDRFYNSPAAARSLH